MNEFPASTDVPQPPPIPSAQQIKELEELGTSYRPLRKAAAVANFSGISTLIIAIASASCAVFSPDWIGILVTIALFAVGGVELIGRGKLLKGERNALKILAWNQVAFFAAIALYCIVQMVGFSSHSLISGDTRSLLAQMNDSGLDKEMEHWARLGTFAIYGTILIGSFFSQGGLALYYARRQNHLNTFTAAPAWQKQLLVGIAR